MQRIRSGEPDDQHLDGGSQKDTCYSECYYPADDRRHIAVCFAGLSVDGDRMFLFAEPVCGKIYGCQKISESDVVVVGVDLFDSAMPVRTVHLFFQFSGYDLFRALPAFIKTESITLGRAACEIFGRKGNGFFEIEILNPGNERMMEPVRSENNIVIDVLIPVAVDMVTCAFIPLSLYA